MLCFCFRHNFNQFLCKSIFWSKPHSCPSPLFCAPPHIPLLNLTVLPLVSIPTNLMWLRATMLSLWDIWYDTNNKRRKELWFCLFNSVLFQAHNPETRQQSSAIWLQIKLTYSTSFTFLFTRTPIRERHPHPHLLRKKRIKMEGIHGMAWVPRWIWSDPTSKDGGFDGFHFSVPIHAVNLSQNWLTRVTRILSAPKFPTEFRCGSNSFYQKFPS